MAVGTTASGAVTEPGGSTSWQVHKRPIASEPGMPNMPAVADRIDERWRRRCATLLSVSDLLVLVWVVIGTYLALDVFDISAPGGQTTQLVVAIGLIVAWFVALTLNDTRSDRVVGVGLAEFKRVFDATLMLFGGIAIAAFVLNLQILRGFLVVALPIGMVLLLVSRAFWRRWLRAMRSNGAYSARVLLVGSAASTAYLAKELARSSGSGYKVVGFWIPESASAEDAQDEDFTVRSITRALDEYRADTVVITGSDALPVDRVKQISWSLESGRRHLVMAPSIADIAGPRIHMRPVAGLPLLHVETPRFSTGQKVLKRSFDIVSVSALIALLSPVLIGVALAVKLTSPGPVLYRQERIGYRGETFRMLKFRSMRPNADQELAALLSAQGTSTTPLFKIKNDPRITPIGRVLRKYSLDELPQLFNVLGGSMSLVGPRPQIAAEVALYSNAAKRRLLARPGITGLWQVSGRSTLDWDQTVRLDLYYVENWSLSGDLGILFKTVKAVAAPGESAH